MTGLPLETKPCWVVLNKTAIDALMMELDFETATISAIYVPMGNEFM
jgi:hypothetical protein